MAKKKLVALCACTMGLAHTFMAAQALEDAAKELGYDVKVETQGADGIQNELTPRRSPTRISLSMRWPSRLRTTNVLIPTTSMRSAFRTRSRTPRELSRKSRVWKAE